MFFNLREKKIVLAMLAILLLGSFFVFYYQENRKFEVFPKKELVYKQEKNLIAEKDTGSKEVTFLFGGDIMFDRYIRTVIGSKGANYIFEDIDETLQGADFVVANLEGPITDSDSVSEDSEFESRENYVFTFPLATANDLKKHNITIVNLGNNHVLNFGESGLAQTKKNLSETGVKYFGDFSEKKYASYVKEHNGIKIGFVCYNQFTVDAKEKTLKEIEETKERADFVVVYAHWGKEYETHSNKDQQALAHAFIDVGAGLIIGSHPHVVQEMEVYKEKRIYYSLGNFIFDQYFQDETKKGLLVRAKIDSQQEIQFEELEIEMTNNGKTTLVIK